jgi:hypothetical protein
MTGDIKGKPVTHKMVAGPTLQGAFTEIYMKDVESKYEARVLIGYDAESNSAIVHWIDSFGAKYSIPHGTSSARDNSIRFNSHSYTVAALSETHSPIIQTLILGYSSSKHLNQMAHGSILHATMSARCN